MIRWFEKSDKLSWVITILIALFIFYMSSKTFEGVAYGVGNLSIVYHFLVFASLNFFLLISSLKGKKNREVFFVCFLISVSYGILDEFHQYFVPGRSSTIFDMFIDSLGISFSAGIYFARVKFFS